MKSLITFLVLLLYVITVSAQDPAIIWQNTIGGVGLDQALAVDITSDGGSIIAGMSFSNISGDKTEDSNGAQDIWVVKLDASGAIQWQNTIGGSGSDDATSIKQTTDGGYIVGGSSDSNISGDKTENSRGGPDFWILKLDTVGNILWQKTYGGAQDDYDVRILQASDGGYFASGLSDSNVSGDKTDPSNGQRDFWAIKMDASGNMQWQNSVGGSLEDRPLANFETNDGGFVMAGLSSSPASGDKSENSQGGNDYWIVKLDASGNVSFDNTIGGGNSDIVRDAISTADGGYLLGGFSLSNASGDKTENSLGAEDYWVLKLDSSGNIIWQNTIGGSGIDYLTNLRELPSGEFIVSGYSQSNISGDKTENTNGGFDLWILKLSATGDILSQNTIGGAADERRAFFERYSNGDYVIACTSNSNISGDKADNSEGSDDYWVFKTNSNILGTTKNDFGFALAAYPNPTNGNFTIDLGESYSETTVTINSMLGQLLSIATYENIQKLEVELNAASGIYLINVKTSEGKNVTFKMAKQ